MRREWEETLRRRAWYIRTPELKRVGGVARRGRGFHIETTAAGTGGSDVIRPKPFIRHSLVLLPGGSGPSRVSRLCQHIDKYKD